MASSNFYSIHIARFLIQNPFVQNVHFITVVELKKILHGKNLKKKLLNLKKNTSLKMSHSFLHSVNLWSWEKLSITEAPFFSFLPLWEKG